MVNIEDKKLIRRLKEILDDNLYDLIIQEIRGKESYFFNPIPDYAIVKKKLDYLFIDNKVLFQLLLLGEAVNIEMVEASMGIDFIYILKELNIISIKDGYIKTNNYILISFMNKYFLVNTPFRNPNCENKNGEVYIGIDSYRLSENLITKNVKKILDLCTGSGIQGICASTFANKVTEVEINPVACNIARFNSILNDLDDKIKVENSYLYESVKNEQFDIIYSNPPFIPVPKEVNFPICGDGGEDGLDIVKKIILGYKHHLNDGGCGIMIGEALGDNNKPFLLNVIEKLLGDGYDSQLLITTKNTATCQISRTLDLAIDISNIECNRTDLYEKWKTLYKNIGATHYYSFYLKVNKIQGGQGKVKLIDLTHSWDPNSIPKLNFDLNIVKLSTIYGVVKNGTVLSSINENTYNMLKLINNDRNINEIYEKLFENNPREIGMRHKDEVIDDIMNLCTIMEQADVIKK